MTVYVDFLENICNHRFTLNFGMDSDIYVFHGNGKTFYSHHRIKRGEIEWKGKVLIIVTLFLSEVQEKIHSKFLNVEFVL